MSDSAPAVHTSPETPSSPEAPWQRLHPLSPLLRGGIVIVVIFGIIFANLRDRLIEMVVADKYIGDTGPSEADLVDYILEAGLLVTALLVCAGIVIVFIAIAWLSWRFHTFRISDEAVEERSGVIFRQHRRAPLDRIQSVNLQRPLIARLLGLTQVEVQTAGQGGKVTLNYLGFHTAKEVREEILRSAARTRVTRETTRSAAGGAATAMAAGMGAVGGRISDVLERRAHELIDSDVDAVAQESGALLTVPVGRLIGSIALSWSLWVPMLLVVASLVSAVLWDPFFLTLLIPAGFVTVAIVFSAFNTGFRFTLSATPDGVRVGSGLTATTTETIPLGRIHAFEARQPLGWRPFGWWKVRITTAGHGLAQGGQNKLQNMVMPVGKIADVELVFATLLSGVADTEAQRFALRAGLLGSGSEGGYQPASKRSPWVLWCGARRAGMLLEESGPADQATLRVRRGWFTRNLVVLPLVRAQSVLIHRPLVQRFLGMATITAHTVLGPVQVYLRGLDARVAQRSFEQLRAGVVRAQQHDAHAFHRRTHLKNGHYAVQRARAELPTYVVDPPQGHTTVQRVSVGDAVAAPVTHVNRSNHDNPSPSQPQHHEGSTR